MSGSERGYEGSVCWILRVAVVTLSRDSFLTFVFLLRHRGWHQELLQKDRLQITRPVHGKDAEIMATTVLLDAVPLAGKSPDVLTTQQRGCTKQMALPCPLSKKFHPHPAPVGTGTCSPGGTCTWGLSAVCRPRRILKEALQFSKLKSPSSF